MKRHGEWYDGYLFGGQDVYCPWDVINYCADLRFDPEAESKAYWPNTSGNDMGRGLIENTSDSTTQFETRSNSGSVHGGFMGRESRGQAKIVYIARCVRDFCLPLSEKTAQNGYLNVCAG